MGAIHLKASYFAIANPLDWIDGRLNGIRHRRRLSLEGVPLALGWTGRAERALDREREPLIVEMQLYFSCVVQKRVLFHPASGFDAAPAIVEVDSRLGLCFRPLASAACEPLEFAARHPAGPELGGGAAARMRPQWLEIDCRRGRWTGNFGYGRK